MNDVINAKCPHCGAVISLVYTQGKSICPICMKQFKNANAIILYEDSLKAERESNGDISSIPDDKWTLDLALSQAEYYFEQKDFEKVRDIMEDALDRGAVDYRIYFNLVRVDTQDLTDYENETHRDYLDLAFEVASEDERKILIESYDEFYVCSFLTEEERKQYYADKNKKRYDELCQKMQPVEEFYSKYKRKLARNRFHLILSPIYVIISIMFVTQDLTTTIPIAPVFFLVGMLFVFFLIGKHSSYKMYCNFANIYLDIFKNLYNFNFDNDVFKQCLSIYEISSKFYENSDHLYDCEVAIYKLHDVLCDNPSPLVLAFLNRDPYLYKLTKKRKKIVI